jgi:hypothetical protein
LDHMSNTSQTHVNSPQSWLMGLWWLIPKAASPLYLSLILQQLLWSLHNKLAHQDHWYSKVWWEAWSKACLFFWTTNFCPPKLLSDFCEVLQPTSSMKKIYSWWVNVFTNASYALNLKTMQKLLNSIFLQIHDLKW